MSHRLNKQRMSAADRSVIDVALRQQSCTGTNNRRQFNPHFLPAPKSPHAKETVNPHDNEIDGFSAFLTLFAIAFDRPTFSLRSFPIDSQYISFKGAYRSYVSHAC
jgi:hypothetical protein